MNVLFDLAIPAAVLGCGLVAGIFFAFSTFVMRALGRRPAGEGIAAMQAINIRCSTHGSSRPSSVRLPCAWYREYRL